MSGIASHLPRFEEASRALFAGDASAFDACIAAWPGDVPAHLRWLARDAFLRADLAALDDFGFPFHDARGRRMTAFLARCAVIQGAALSHAPKAGSSLHN